MIAPSPNFRRRRVSTCAMSHHHGTMTSQSSFRYTTRSCTPRTANVIRSTSVQKQTGSTRSTTHDARICGPQVERSPRGGVMHAFQSTPTAIGPACVHVCVCVCACASVCLSVCLCSLTSLFLPLPFPLTHTHTHSLSLSLSLSLSPSPSHSHSPPCTLVPGAVLDDRAAAGNAAKLCAQGGHVWLQPVCVHVVVCRAHRLDNELCTKLSFVLPVFACFACFAFCLRRRTLHRDDSKM